jgi:hypothetical protein
VKTTMKKNVMTGIFLAMICAISTGARASDRSNALDKEVDYYTCFSDNENTAYSVSIHDQKKDGKIFVHYYDLVHVRPHSGWPEWKWFGMDMFEQIDGSVNEYKVDDVTSLEKQKYFGSEMKIHRDKAGKIKKIDYTFKSGNTATYESCMN